MNKTKVNREHKEFTVAIEPEYKPNVAKIEEELRFIELALLEMEMPFTGNVAADIKSKLVIVSKFNMIANTLRSLL